MGGRGARSASGGAGGKTSSYGLNIPDEGRLVDLQLADWIYNKKVTIL